MELRFKNISYNMFISKSSRFDYNQRVNIKGLFHANDIAFY